MRLTARTRIIVGALSLAAIAAPAASARVGLDVRPNPDQQSTQAGPVAPPILRVARASELAAIKRAEVQQEAARSYSPPAGARYSSADTDAYAAVAHPVAVSAPWAARRRQVKSWFGAMPFWRAAKLTVMPGAKVCSTRRMFSAAVQRRRR